MGNFLNTRNVIIDILKGIAIGLVVIGHVIQFGTIGDGFWANDLFKIIYSFHMPLFIFVSGYVSIKGITQRSVFETIKKRFFTLIIPFLAWAVIMYLYLIVGNFVLGSQTELNFLKYIGRAILYPGNSLWFLWVLFFLNILLAVIFKLTPRLRIIFSIIFYIMILAIPLSDLFYIYMIKWLYPFFFVGAYLYIYKQHLKNIIKPIST